MEKYYTASDVTQNRCTITGCYARRSEAEAAVESDDLAQVFASEQTIEIGARAVQDGEYCWRVEPVGRIDGSETEAEAKSRDGKWYVCPADNTADAYAAGYDGNVFATEDEALVAIAGLADALNTAEAYWTVSQYEVQS